jgi:filamentous hemagglutinin family protein
MRLPRLRIAAAAAVACFLAGNAAANPTGMQVVAGQVSTVTSGNQLLITNSPGTILNWQSFSIMPGELTRFLQQNSSSSVLNRIAGQNPSQILGALQSNGKVFLINPNGIVFGAGSHVDVNGLVASSLNISNADFLAGRLRFSGTGTPGNISNSGGITTPSGGQVYLIAPNVTNSGIITSPGGDVLLAAGHSVDLADSNDPDVRVVVSAPGDQALNIGKVVAESGRVGVYGALVNQLGLVSANSAVAGENGKIVFKSTDTTSLGAGSVTTATGVGAGGTVAVLGNRVGLTGDAVVDASGQTGGGTVLIGGDTHGNNPLIQNAALTYVGPQAQVDADASHSGAGGKVVVWSDQQTQMYGTISARGGAAGGDGGFVETSSASKLDFTGEVDLRAPRGAAGTLLLDPSDILINTNDSTGDISVAGTAPFTISASNASSVLSTAELQSQLALGNVAVTTSSGASAPLSGTITVAAPVAWTNSNSLTLAADQDININAPITAPSGTLVLSATNGNIAQAINSLNPATISVAALSASAPMGSVSLTEPTNSISGAVAGVGAQGFSLNAGAINVGTVGTVTGITGGAIASLSYGVDLTTSTGDIAVGAPINGGTYTVVLNSAGAVTQGTGGLVSANSLIVLANGAAGIGGGGTPLLVNVGTLQNATSQGPVLISNSGDLVIDYVSASGAVAINSGGSLSTATPQTCDCTLSITGSSVALTAAGSMLVSAGYNITATDGVSLTAGYNASSGTYVGSNNTLTVDGDVSAATIGLAAGGAISVTGTLTGAVTQTPNLYSAPLPTLDQCIATPTLPGCSAVLPTLAQCTATPTTPGCSVVLPTLAQCTSAPTAAGCSAVLPTLAQCTSAPTTIGCSAVLPTLAQCTSTPTAAGCSAVLPTLAQCTSAPTTSGCSVVLPTLAQCTSTPTTAGCTSVLPTLAQCTSTPTAPGCSVVLPTIAQCTSAPTTAGCTAVLPTLAQCTSTPSAAGCNVVLPTIAQCTSAPTTAGCSVVLPTLAQCISTPTAAGCAVVLPSLAQCTSTPSAAGCNVVLPTIAQCTSAPTAVGCSVVLPTLSQCISTPAAAGCAAILPTLAQCISTPTMAGCGAVLPPVSQCASNPAAPGCVVVLPPVAQTTSSTPVNQAINSTVSLINTTTTAVTTPTPVSIAASAPKTTDSSTQGSPDSGGAASSDKSNTTSEKTNAGTPNNDTVKKMYCN